MLRLTGGNKTLADLQAEGLMTHGFTGDPTFVDGPNHDFRLQTSSPCKNTGKDVGLTADILGNPLVGTPDIGAYEYQS